MDSAQQKSIRLPTFDGQAKNFQVWWIRFTAFCAVYKCQQACRPVAETDLPATEAEADVLDAEDDENAPAIAARKRNDTVFANLTLAFTTSDLLLLVMRAKDQHWPSGLAWKIIQGLSRMYQPADTISRVEIRRELNQVKMKANEDPKTLFAQLGKIQLKSIDHPIEMEDLIAVVLDAAPVEYQGVLTAEQRRHGKDLTLEQLEEAMEQHYRSIKDKVGSGSNNNRTEVSLVAFGGTCWNCGERGHRSSQCSKPKKNGSNNRGNNNNSNKSGKSSKKCFNCGKIGHVSPDCWLKEENARKRPSWFKTGTAAAAVDFELLLCSICEELDEQESKEKKKKGQKTDQEEDSGYELALKNSNTLTVPETLKMLSDPNIWILDTAATSTTTPYDFGFQNTKASFQE